MIWGLDSKLFPALCGELDVTQPNDVAHSRLQCTRSTSRRSGMFYEKGLTKMMSFNIRAERANMFICGKHPPDVSYGVLSDFWQIRLFLSPQPIKTASVGQRVGYYLSVVFFSKVSWSTTESFTKAPRLFFTTVYHHTFRQFLSDSAEDILKVFKYFLKRPHGVMSHFIF